MPAVYTRSETDLRVRWGQIEDMARERHRLESCVLEMNTRRGEVERWLTANEAKTPTGGWVGS